MASLSDIRRRIGSVKNTRQITRAMKLVAGAKLRRATEAAMAARPYSEALTRVLSRVVEATGDLKEWKPVQTLVGSGERTRFTPEQEPKATNRYFRVKRRN